MARSITDRVRDILAFGRSDRNGVVALSFLLLLVLGINVALPWLIREEEFDFTAFLQEVENHASETSKENGAGGVTEAQTSLLNPFPFDPNGLPEDTWRQLGLSDRQISNIKNFERKGGVFRTKADLARMYSISEAEYQALEPFIIISSNENANSSYAPKEPIRKISPFPFNPNDLSEEQWKELGLDDRLISTVLNYRQKGGVFRKADDLKRIYGMEDTLFNLLEPYIVIPERKDTMPSGNKAFAVKPVVVDINTADTLDIQQLRGIGPSFARRIVKYREALGGFVCKEQILEVYGMDSIRYQGIADNIFLTATPLKQININTAELKELMRHPYIEFHLAKSIIRHREKIKIYRHIEEVRDAELVYAELFSKIAPYLTTE